MVIIYTLLGTISAVIGAQHVFLREVGQNIYPYWYAVFRRDLFISGAGLSDVWMLLNRKRVYGKLFSEDNQPSTTDLKPFVYICPTLYRENENEMETLLTSILSLNDDRVEMNVNKSARNYRYNFETHVFFDKPFENRDVADDDCKECDHDANKACKECLDKNRFGPRKFNKEANSLLKVLANICKRTRQTIYKGDTHGQFNNICAESLPTGGRGLKRYAEMRSKVKAQTLLN